MTKLSGGDSKSKKVMKVAETTNEAYTTAAKAVLSQATGAFAKLFVTNPVKGEGVRRRALGVRAISQD